MTKRKLAQILRKARKLLEKGWTQGHWARDKEGLPADWASKEAACFCLGGAMRRAVVDAGAHAVEYHAATRELHTVMGFRLGSIPPWNDADTRRPHHVLARVDKGIAKLEAAK